MKKMNTECEKKFLVISDEYKTLSSSHYLITQAYLSKDALRSVRIRIINDKAFLTIKSAPQNSTFTHFEWEKEISLEDGKKLLALCFTPYIEKTRWIVPINENLKWEIDEFHERLNGLVIAEIELENETQAFPHPRFIGKEVTFDAKYYNVNL